MRAIPTSTPPRAIPTMPPMGNDEPSLLSPVSSFEVDVPGTVEPVLEDEGLDSLPLETSKVSKEADLLVVGNVLDPLSEDVRVAELSEGVDEDVLDGVLDS